MNVYAEKIQDKTRQSAANHVAQARRSDRPPRYFPDNRPQSLVQRKIIEASRNSPRVVQLRAIQHMADLRSQADAPIQLYDPGGGMAGGLGGNKYAGNGSAKENSTGLPDSLKSSLESLSGYAMDDVRVHYNSDKPAQLQAHAYTQGADIHIAAGQEKHLAHEAWHVVQQKQGRVRPTIQLKSKVGINDDPSLETEADIMADKLMASQVSEQSVASSSVSPAHQNNINANDLPIQRVITFGENQTISALTIPMPAHRTQYESVVSEVPLSEERFGEKRYVRMQQPIMTPFLLSLQAMIPILLGKTYEGAIDILLQRIENDLSSALFFSLPGEKREEIMQQVNLLFPEMRARPNLGEEGARLDTIISAYISMFDNLSHAEPEGDDDMARDERERPTRESILQLFLMHDSALQERIGTWLGRLGNRSAKSSNAYTKRQKRLNDTGDQSLLMFTHTAPAEELTENLSQQGKDVYPGRSQFNYYRTGDNKQSTFFKHSGRKSYIFVRELYDFYKELDGSANFRNFAELIPGVDIAAFGSGRYNHSGYGAEVNAYVKGKLLREAGREHEGAPLDVDETRAKQYMDTSNSYATHRYIERLADTGTQFGASYTSILLQHARDVVARLKTLKLKNFKIVTGREDSGFITYPCPIIEPMPGQRLRVDDIKVFINVIVERFNRESKIKLYQRNSFGFLYPTIADLERSIRIWPGQVDPEFFSEKIANILISYDRELSGAEGEDVEVARSDPRIKDDHQHATLFSTLARSMEHIKLIYRSGTFQPGPTLHFLHQRIVSNLTKARIILDMRRQQDFSGMDKEDLFLEITQIIENLNEYGFQLVELQQWAPTSEDFKRSVTAAYAPYTNTSGFTLIGEALTHSGMQAGMIALNLRKTSVFDLGPAYFEFPSADALNSDSFGKTETMGRTAHYDPAYNFTHTTETEDHRVTPFRGSSHQAVILDITNVKPSELPGVIAPHARAQSIFLYGSLSKHFQLGMDRFTLGLVLELSKTALAPTQLGTYALPPELIRYFILMQNTQSLGMENEGVV